MCVCVCVCECVCMFFLLIYSVYAASTNVRMTI